LISCFSVKHFISCFSLFVINLCTLSFLSLLLRLWSAFFGLHTTLNRRFCGALNTKGELFYLLGQQGLPLVSTDVAQDACMLFLLRVCCTSALIANTRTKEAAAAGRCSRCCSWISGIRRRALSCGPHIGCEPLYKSRPEKEPELRRKSAQHSQTWSHEPTAPCNTPPRPPSFSSPLLVVHRQDLFESRGG
jgi:hypothetical protein